MRLNFSFVSVNAILYFRIVAQKISTAVLSLLNLTQNDLGSVIPGGADIFNLVAK